MIQQLYSWAFTLEEKCQNLCLHKTCNYTEMWMFTVGLFIIVKTSNQPNWNGSFYKVNG